MASKSWASSGHYTFTLPSNIDLATPLSVTLKGAGGGSSQGGAGGRVVGTLDISALVPGTSKIEVYVGGAGGAADDSTGLGGSSGFNGGGGGGDSVGDHTTSNGFGGYGGGGGTDIRVGGTALANRRAVAAGGGGAGRLSISAATGGQGGVDPGGRAFPTSHTTAAVGIGGSGGSTTAGGAVGAPGSGGVNNAVAGSSGQGGRGGTATTGGFSCGGGGGGGYFGGGGGGNSPSTTSGGGGGGSNYAGGAGFTTATNDMSGSAANTDGSVTFTYNLAPNQSDLSSPVTGSSLRTDKPIGITWTFSDPDPADTQLKADVRWRVAGGDWTTISAPASTLVGTSYIFVANTFTSYVGQSIEWQVRTYDTQGAVGPWSASAYFTPVAKPTLPTFTRPLVINSPAITAYIGMPDGADQLYAALYADSGGSLGALLQLVGPVSCSQRQGETVVFGPTPVNGQSYHVVAYYSHVPGVFSDNLDSGPVVANVNSPQQPTLRVYGFPDTASVRVEIANPTPDAYPPDWNDVYRQPMFGSDPEIRIATQIALNGVYTDWAAGLHRPYRYRVQAVRVSNNSYTSSD